MKLGLLAIPLALSLLLGCSHRSTERPTATDGVERSPGAAMASTDPSALQEGNGATEDPGEEVPPERSAVWIETDAATYSVDTEWIQTVWHNDSQSPICFGEMYVLEAKRGDDWAKVNDYWEDPFFNLPAYSIAPGESRGQAYWVRAYAATLPEGTYRIRAKYDHGSNQQTYQAVGVFDVREAK